VNKPRAIRLNAWATYLSGTGCVKLANGGIIELTVAEEELLELLLRTPKVTVRWTWLEYELARSKLTIRHLMRTVRDKLGSRAIRTHTGIGVSIQPQFVGTRRYALSDHPLRAIPGPAQAEAERALTALEAWPRELPVWRAAK
jgi:hypothetical protein